MARSNFSWKDRIRSFSYAFNGLKIVWQEEHNFRIHLIAAVVAIVLSYLLRISPYEWLAIIFSIGFVLVCELLNTALEHLADFVCQEKKSQHQKDQRRCCCRGHAEQYHSATDRTDYIYPKTPAMVLIGSAFLGQIFHHKPIYQAQQKTSSLLFLPYHQNLQQLGFWRI